MDFKHRKRIPKIISGSLCELYQHDVQLYLVPPATEISLNEFEDLAVERLEVLRIIEHANLKGHKTYSDDWKNCIMSDLRKANYHKYVRLLQNKGTTNTESDLQARRADHISHFILRLAYCRSDELRRWFLSRELELFKLRFQNLTPAAVKRFIEINHLNYVPILHSEKETIEEFLYESTPHMSRALVETYDFYKVHFSEVIALVKKKRIYLKNGFAYIPSTELISSIITLHRMNLNEALAYACRMVPSVDDDRVMNMLTDLHTSYTGNTYSEAATDKDAIDISKLDLYAKKSFPLCMRNVHELLRATHHLKHGARLQYGLFLKGIGVTFEDSMKFWRDEFCKLMDGDKFDKQYSYNVKHSYGKVGRMLSYSPHGCMKIISQSLSAGDQHGCPYKQWDMAQLKKKMIEYGISTQGVQEVIELASKGHYQIACTKCYEVTHGSPSKNVINHPNQYFEESQELSKEKL